MEARGEGDAVERGTRKEGCAPKEISQQIAVERFNFRTRLPIEWSNPMTERSREAGFAEFGYAGLHLPKDHTARFRHCEPHQMLQVFVALDSEHRGVRIQVTVAV
jgi:hypothetical protein